MTHPIPKPSNHTKEAGMSTQEKLAAQLRQRADEMDRRMGATDVASSMREAATLLSEHGEVVITTDASGRCVAVTRQDGEGRILSTIWEASEHGGGGEAVAWRGIGTLPEDDRLVLAKCDDGRAMVWRASILARNLCGPTPEHLQFPATKWMPIPGDGLPSGKFNCPACDGDGWVDSAPRPLCGPPRYLDDAPTPSAPVAEVCYDSLGVGHMVWAKECGKGNRPPHGTLLYAGAPPSAPVVDDAMGHIAMLRSLRMMYDDGLMQADDHPGTVAALDAAIAALSGVSAPVGRHWCFAAAEGLRPLVREMSADAGALGRTHLLSMLDRMKQEEMSATKGCRWLGWIQAALVDAGPATLEMMKAHNLSYSREAPPAAAPTQEKGNG